MISTDIIKYFENKSGQLLNSDEGLFFGSPSKKVTKILFCWMADKRAIEKAAENKCSHIITHESLFYPYNADLRKKEFRKYVDWGINKNRIKMLKENNITVLRIHGTLDTLIIIDEFALTLGLSNCIKEDGFVRIYSINPMTIDQLTAYVKMRMDTTPLRVAVPDGFNKTIKKIGLPWGGLGLFVNVNFQQKLIDEGVDAMIGGETDSYGMIFAKEQGIPFIETGHEASELPGLYKFSKILEKDLQIRVYYHENKPCYKFI